MPSTHHDGRLPNCTRPDATHPQFQRLREAFGLLHEVIDNWNEDEVASYPQRLPSFDEYVSDIEAAVFEIEWK